MNDQQRESKNEVLYDYLRSLKGFVQRKEDLNDPNKYYLTPCRYIRGNPQYGDQRVSFKLTKQDAHRRDQSHP